MLDKNGNEIKIGDKVRYQMITGRVVSLRAYDYSVGVDFECNMFTGLHDLGGVINTNTGYWCSPNHISVKEEYCVVI